MSISNLTPRVSANLERTASTIAPKQRIRVLAAFALIAALGACTGKFVEARPVCIKPHGGANFQLAPSYQCEAKVHGRRWVNR